MSAREQVLLPPYAYHQRCNVCLPDVVTLNAPQMPVLRRKFAIVIKDNVLIIRRKRAAHSSTPCNQWCARIVRIAVTMVPWGNVAQTVSRRVFKSRASGNTNITHAMVGRENKSRSVVTVKVFD